MVKISSIVCMSITLVASVTVPVFLLIRNIRARGAKLIPAFLGATAFLVFFLLIKGQINLLYLDRNLADTDAFNVNPWAYAAFFSVLTAAVEGLGLALCFALFKKRIASPRDSMMFGLGYGTTGVLLFTTAVMANNLLNSFLINTDGFDYLIQASENAVQADQNRNLKALLIGTGAADYITAGIEQFATFLLQVCLCLLFFAAFRNKKPLYAAAGVFCYAISVFPLAYYRIVPEYLYLIELFFFIFAVSGSAVCRSLTKRLNEDNVA